MGTLQYKSFEISKQNSFQTQMRKATQLPLAVGDQLPLAVGDFLKLSCLEVSILIPQLNPGHELFKARNPQKGSFRCLSASQKWTHVLDLT